MICLSSAAAVDITNIDPADAVYMYNATREYPQLTNLIAQQKTAIGQRDYIISTMSNRAAEKDRYHKLDLKEEKGKRAGRVAGAAAASSVITAALIAIIRYVVVPKIY